MIKTPLMRKNSLDGLRAIAAQYGIRFAYDPTVVSKHTGDPSPLRHRPQDDGVAGIHAPHRHAGNLEYCRRPTITFGFAVSA